MDTTAIVERIRGAILEVEDPPAAEVVDAALAEVDVTALALEADALYVSEVWDGESSINGVDPDTVRAAHQIPEGGEVYLVRVAETGEVITFQPFDPDAAGFHPMTTVRAVEAAQVERLGMAERVAEDRIRGAVAAHLPDRPAPDA
jgi:hypothetical protein